ncbi:Asp-tRNA(Asn)/Glu-tRNA(Gln) amidotransferase subunit GatB [Candidatus Zinderia endosymbiont of Aphrophora alni]|uniref:Asp-tRNA(Asn)/Glu-tRNA(Gln) amidotransferase subunit GatB n=1 Tax=Candidatus Zinderia endosymbiont of Aphrophora alni TaxID=3077951 RepID=UPI0030D070E7
MKWKIKIGIETHIRLLTKTKIFSNTSNKFGEKPNTLVNAIDLALPGTLPTINKKTIKLALKFGIAISGKISSNLLFCRKNYFYPDLPKGYQITQYKKPIIKGGKISFFNEKNNIRTIKLISAHLEEDSGKIFHKYYKNMIGIDYNRSGNALLEVVTKPMIKSSYEAVKYLKTLYNIVTWLNICDGNLQNGSFRSDINISINKNKKNNGIKCEIKNLNSFKFIKNAIDYEFIRQKKILKKGEKIIQETRTYNPNTKKTEYIRKKNSQKEYKYLLEPDLPEIKIPKKIIEKIKNQKTKLPFEIQKKIIKKYNLSIKNAIFLTKFKYLFQYFKKTLKLINKEQIKLLLNWLKCEFMFFFKKKIKKISLKPKHFSLLLINIYNKNISNKIAKKIFLKLIKFKKIKSIEVNNLINFYKIDKNFKSSKLKIILKKILKKNLNLIKEIKNKNKKIINFIIGKILKKTKNKINPKEIKIFIEKYFKK